MNTTSRAIAGIAVVAALWVGGCGADGSGGSDSAGRSDSAVASPTPRNETTFAPLPPVTAAGSGPDVSSPLQDRASKAATVDASRSGPARADAERFALIFSQAVVDLRDPVDIEALLDEVGADDLPPSTRSGLVDEVEQASAGLDRFWKTDDPMWIRTQLVGGTEEPSSVMVEIAGSIGVTQWPDYTGWLLLRIDVVRADDQWEVSGFSAGGRRARPDDADPQLRDQLEGKGWRRVI